MTDARQQVSHYGHKRLELPRGSVVCGVSAFSVDYLPPVALRALVEAATRALHNELWATERGKELDAALMPFQEFFND